MMHPFLRELNFGTEFKVGFALLLVALADFCFYNHVIGWLLGAFAIVLLGLFLLCNTAALNSGIGKITAFFTFFQALFLIDYQDFFTIGLYGLSLASLAVLGRTGAYANALTHANAVRRYLLFSLFKVPRDFACYVGAVNRHRMPGTFERFARRWLLPLVCASVFVTLFASANPVMSGWMDNIRWGEMFENISIGRPFFWFVMLVLIWPVMRPGLRAPDVNKGQGGMGTAIGWLFTPESILRSLILFNLLFAMQTAMDVIYLWGGTVLPDGLTYAEYAQRGAYPLIFTALLAAAFVLIALRADNRDSTPAWTINLIYVWILQNVFLVVSSLWRTHLYIQEYSLTTLRLAAVIWMVLVAVGLVLVIVRIACRKSNAWLVNRNAIILAATLFIYSGINVPGVIAHYNVRHNAQISGQGQPIDLPYLASFGSAALPAVDWLAANNNGKIKPGLIKRVQELAEEKLAFGMSYWRAWSFKSYRIHLQRRKALQDKL